MLSTPVLFVFDEGVSAFTVKLPLGREPGRGASTFAGALPATNTAAGEPTMLPGGVPQLMGKFGEAGHPMFVGAMPGMRDGMGTLAVTGGFLNMLVGPGNVSGPLVSAAAASFSMLVRLPSLAELRRVGIEAATVACAAAVATWFWFDSVTMSNKLALRLRLLTLLSRMKYFCAWLATCVGVRVCT